MNISDDQLIDAVEKHGSQRKAAFALGLNRRTVERRLARMADEAVRRKLLVIDLETSPNVAYVWGMFNQNVSLSQVVEFGRILCIAAKWHGEEGTMFYAEWQPGGYERMIRAAHRLLCEADAVLGWNSDRYDIRWLMQAFYDLGLRRPAGFKKVDLMRKQKGYRWLPSNKLEHARNRRGSGKGETGGFPLWPKVLAGDKAARRTMEVYNRRDVEETDAELTYAMQGGWVTGLPNMSVHSGDVCPCCGSDKLKADSYYQTQTRRYQQWVCLDCGAPSRSVKCEPGAARLKEVA